MTDLISRQEAIDALKDMYHAAEKWGAEASDDVIKARAESCMASLVEMKLRIEKLPSAQPTEASCWGCNCPKMERLKKQKTFSEMVHLHDAETHEERMETRACDLISRQEERRWDGEIN